jgi:hypothetical protein
VYINGIYWGVYNAAERPDAAFAASYYGGEREQWDVMNIKYGKEEVTDGSLDAWHTLLEMAEGVSMATSPEEANAAYMRLQGLNPDGSDNPAWESYLDVDNYIDYLLINYFIENKDWPHNNVYAARRRGPESQGFTFHVWDAEWTLLGGRLSGWEIVIGDSPGGMDLRNSQEFRIRFADRVQKHFSVGGALYVNPEAQRWDPAHPEHNAPAARYAEVTNEVRRGLVAESARWGDGDSRVPITPNEQWETERDYLLRFYFPFRSKILLEDLVSAGLYTLVDAPTFNQNGGDVSAGFQLQFATTEPTDTIYYTIDGSDPRLIGGDVSPSAIEYSGPNALNEDVTIRTRAWRPTLDESHWSSLEEEAFRVTVSPTPLRGDYDGNGAVEQADLDLVLAHWGQAAMLRPDNWVNDLPHGIIDQDELDRALINWGMGVKTSQNAP